MTDLKPETLSYTFADVFSGRGETRRTVQIIPRMNARSA
jgi:hypothetical protein